MASTALVRTSSIISETSPEALKQTLKASGITPGSLNEAINNLRKGRTADSASAENAYDALNRLINLFQAVSQS